VDTVTAVDLAARVDVDPFLDAPATTGGGLIRRLPTF
jgi:hypothetical protein